MTWELGFFFSFFFFAFFFVDSKRHLSTWKNPYHVGSNAWPSCCKARAEPLNHCVMHWFDIWANICSVNVCHIVFLSPAQVGAAARQCYCCCCSVVGRRRCSRWGGRGERSAVVPALTLSQSGSDWGSAGLLLLLRFAPTAVPSLRNFYKTFLKSLKLLFLSGRLCCLYVRRILATDKGGWSVIAEKNGEAQR